MGRVVLVMESESIAASISRATEPHHLRTLYEEIWSPRNLTLLCYLELIFVAANVSRGFVIVSLWIRHSSVIVSSQRVRHGFVNTPSEVPVEMMCVETIHLSRKDICYCLVSVSLVVFVPASSFFAVAVPVSVSVTILGRSTRKAPGIVYMPRR
jgi:hypothetical protein